MYSVDDEATDQTGTINTIGDKKQKKLLLTKTSGQGEASYDKLESPGKKINQNNIYSWCQCNEFDILVDIFCWICYFCCYYAVKSTFCFAYLYFIFVFLFLQLLDASFDNENYEDDITSTEDVKVETENATAKRKNDVNSDGECDDGNTDSDEDNKMPTGKQNHNRNQEIQLFWLRLI